MERGSSPSPYILKFLKRKYFENLLKKGVVLDYFSSLSQVFKYFCMEV